MLTMEQIATIMIKWRDGPSGSQCVTHPIVTSVIDSSNRKMVPFLIMVPMATKVHIATMVKMAGNYQQWNTIVDNQQ